MKLMIVDDELQQRQGLANHIPWGAHGIEVVALAASGAEALHLAERKKPDILLIDVQMPQMDGLTLVRKLRERPETSAFTKLIIVSGHDNFRYAQDALGQGVSQYLLKPVDDGELLEAVLRAGRELRAELERWREEAALRERWTAHLPHLQSAFLQRWTSGAYDETTVLRRCEDYGVALRADQCFVVAVVDVDPLPGPGRYGDAAGMTGEPTREDNGQARGRGGSRAASVPAGGAAQPEAAGAGDHKPSADAAVGREAVSPGQWADRAFGSPLSQFEVEHLAREILAAASCWIASDASGRTLLIFTMPPEDDPDDCALRVHASVGRLLSHVRETLGLSASAGICARAGGIGDTAELYAQACRALQERIVYGGGIAIPYAAERQAGDAPPAAPTPGSEHALELALETGDETQAQAALRLLWDDSLARAETAEDVHEAVLYASHLLLRAIRKRGWTIRQVAGEDADYFHHVRSLASQAQAWDWLSRMAARICTYLQCRRKTTNNQVVRAILKIVDGELDQDITLHTVADRLYVNSSYLSRLFKQETGVSFSAYVLERKMERAKAFLRDGGRVYDAARLVGYRDVSYFTKVFRKYWGITPGGMKSG
ncbi:response regulator [Paenibacillus sp. IB182496]|uniref:Response regulator n=1 Tax=Paenibacillus sabuli TaxID=2772509 RepID=A0A927GRZ4_9BACL|nr:response regulator [Paenibacillus sabuli]MBD2845505.1 response regulator [Paenibacillus sabuli]